jgi:hypothetical protein
VGPNETAPVTRRHPKGDACIEMGDTTRHQLKLSVLGVSLRALTRVTGKSAREGIGHIAGRLIDHRLRSRCCDNDSRCRQNKQPRNHADTHNRYEHEARRPPIS